MSRTRLYVPAERLAGGRLVLTDDDHQHVARVLRARVGDRLTLFDGAGTEVDAEVVRVGKRDTALALGARRAGSVTASPVAITLLVAVPRGERMDLIVQKTTELGVGRIVPIVTERSVARPDPTRRARWEKIAREAARQCGRADAPARRRGDRARARRGRARAPPRALRAVGEPSAASAAARAPRSRRRAGRRCSSVPREASPPRRSRRPPPRASCP